MYRSYSVSQLVTRYSLAAMFALLVLTVFGCSSTGGSNADFSLSPQVLSETSGDGQSNAVAPGNHDFDRGGVPEECMLRKIGYVTFLNRLRCEPVQVVVDGLLFAKIEPGAGLDAILPYGEHSLEFADYKTGQTLRETKVFLKPCQEILFATEVDICAEAKQ